MCQRTTVDQCVRFLEKVCTKTSTPTLEATPKTARLLLTALLVHAHPSFLDHANEREAPDGRDVDREYSASAVRRALSQAVASDAERLVETVANQHLTAFVRALVAFRASFEAWKCADREALLDVLVGSYVNLAASIAEMDAVSAAAEEEQPHEDTESTPSPTTLRESLCASMRGLEAKAEKLGVSWTDFHKRVAAATPLPASSDEDDDDAHTSAWAEAVTAVASTCERAFWDAFTAKLQAGDLTPLRAQLDEVVTKLKALTPHRTDLHATLDHAVDVDLVVQMAEHDALDAPTFDALANTLIDTLVSLQAPAATSTTRAWVSTWRAQWCDGTHAYALLLPPFFAALHRDIDTALDACAEVRANRT